MFILRDLIIPLKACFSDTTQGEKRAAWFVYTLMAIIVPFTSSITSNLIRSLRTLFGLEFDSKRFYTFMASSTLPWAKLWPALWSLIPSPVIDDRILIALDDSINPKTGKKIFACGHFHDHAAKEEGSSYPWSQCIVAIGLLKKVHSRWACLPLDFRFYMMAKDIEANKINCRRNGKTLPFETKMRQAASMLKAVYSHFE